jgi:hypothetical protein
MENWSDLIAPILSGGFAGAAVLGLLFKLLLNNQLEKSLKQYQHDLDTKKEKLQVELAVIAEHAKLKITNHRQKSITALELIYGAFVRTSLPRQRFVKASALLMQISTSNEKANSEYFRLFSENFQAFDRAFQSVATGFASLEENAIYLDNKLEQQVVAALREVNVCYQKWHAELRAAHDSAQAIFRDGALNQQKRTMDFDNFFVALSGDWNRIAGPVTASLKSNVRELLNPEEI